MKRLLAGVAVLLCICLTGCDSIFDGKYVSVVPHEIPSAKPSDQTVSAANYKQLYAALTDLVESGIEERIITISGYNKSVLDIDMELAIQTILEDHPIGAYAVEEITCEQGKKGSLDALAVKIRYSHNRTEIRKIRQVADVEEARTAIAEALNACEPGIVLRINSYRETDYALIVENHGLENPHLVMEIPQVMVNNYPETGPDRVVELRFTYQTSRDSLRMMQNEVAPVFTSASLYASTEASDHEKYTQMYSFLMERYEYTLETSITPTYSLLRHGVGDSCAFATVYSAMCRQIALECLVVSGTHDGESRYWNIVCDGGVYYHVDLLAGEFRELTDEEMMGYVWDYSAYPVCGPTQEEEN